jgi:hypothetical protein
MVSTAGFWTKTELQQSINIRELMTILFAIQLHASRCEDSAIKIYSDNITALKYTTKDGGTSSLALQDLAIKIQELINKHRLTVQYQHVPGIMNVEADKLSRERKPFYESTIPKKVFNQIIKQWGPLAIDTFAARHNHQLPIYWSIRPDSSAAAIDAFQQRWLPRGMYLNLPWKLIPRVLRTIQAQQLQQAVLVTPWWFS